MVGRSNVPIPYFLFKQVLLPLFLRSFVSPCKESLREGLRRWLDLAYGFEQAREIKLRSDRFVTPHDKAQPG